MNAFVAIALFGWLPLGLTLFATFTVRTAVLLTVIGGWLFLPVASLGVAGLPNYTKAAAVSVATLAGLLLLGGRPFAGLRLHRHDLPFLLWCLVPAASSLGNGHGAYDAVAVTLTRVIEWGVPYLVGRAVFADFAGAEQLARGLFVGGLVYVPFCLYEVRMSPQLHATVYGFAQHSFAQCIRLEGYRPMVFMEHGLMVALWMGIATIAGFALWRHGGLRWLAGAPAALLLALLLVATILCKSMGALVLLGAGLAAMAAARRWRSRLPVVLLMGMPLLFVGARLGLDWQAGGVIGLIGQYAPERASSLQFRVDSEQVLLTGVWQRPWLGWSSWGYDPAPSGDDGPVARDGFWLITVCNSGLVGLALFFGIHFLPIATLLRRLSWRTWLERRAVGVTVLVIALCLFVCDCMFNAMINPVYILVLGSVTSLAVGAKSSTAARVLVAPRRRRSRRLVLCTS